MPIYGIIVGLERPKNMFKCHCLISFTYSWIFGIINAFWRTNNQSFKILYTHICVQWHFKFLSRDSPVRIFKMCQLLKENMFKVENIPSPLIKSCKTTLNKPTKYQSYAWQTTMYIWILDIYIYRYTNNIKQMKYKSKNRNPLNTKLL